MLSLSFAFACIALVRVAVGIWVAGYYIYIAQHVATEAWESAILIGLLDCFV